MRLKPSLIHVCDVTPQQRRQMLALMQRYYENVTESNFTADLAEKRWVILLSDPRADEICGFSTQGLFTVNIHNRTVTALFSGDTIIDQDHRGDVALSHVWGRLALSLIDQHPQRDLYWFLISKGYKTYRFLPLFFHEFYPRPNAENPPWARELIDALGEYKFQDRYDPATGVVKGDLSKDRLRPGVADLTPQRLHDPYVRFFVERNPGHRRGDELCCVAPLTRENFNPAAYRVINAAEPVVA